MELSIRHTTVYRFSQPARYTIQYLRLTPRNDTNQRVNSWSLRAPGQLRRHIDAFGNIMHVLVLDEVHHELTIAVEGSVTSFDTGGTTSGEGDQISPLVYLRATALTEPTGIVRDFAAPLQGLMTRDRLDGLHELSRAVARQVAYLTGSTDVETTAADALSHGQGVCQDQAHVFTAAARALGVPTRYVSGYVHVRENSVASEDGSTVMPSNADAASHAWSESWVDDLGWVAFDVTNEICANDAHVRLAVGPDYTACAPIRGMRHGGGAESLKVNVMVADQSQ
jgi:transglutaminase-like putative cysteine protease